MPRQSSFFPNTNCADFLDGLKQRIRLAQVKAALAVNRELVLLYWQVGQEILSRQQKNGWGAKIIDQLAKDLKREFPDVSGFSSRNLKYMRVFAEAYPDELIVQEVLAQIPWYHNIALLEKLKSREQRLWYAQETVSNGWSRNVLVLQIESNLYQRQGGAITNFERVLPSSQSDLAQQLIKSPYNFDYLTISKDAYERELERGLTYHIRDSLLELGLGFSFLGSQYPLVVSDKEYRLDLLFYHVRLHCYIVIDLKMGEFEPQHSGQRAFYVAAVDNLLRGDRNDPTIGIILCKSKDKTIVEYALPGKPTAYWSLYLSASVSTSPNFQENLPMVEELQLELSIAIDDKEINLNNLQK